jgi:leucyl-tRNA synthetase
MKVGKYFPKEIESKWQKTWKEAGIYKFTKDSKKQKYYNLVELPYPSGDLHLGHWFAFVPPDAHARYKKMEGFDVFFPNGFDAFGLPAENAAIKRGIHPKDWTMKNIETMRAQFETMGTMIDWHHTAVTCLPDYYRWNQWIFLKMFEKGIAYRGKALSNWCPTDQTVLANEHIEAGRCWRCGTEVIQKEVEQWFLAITKYADDLIWRQDSKIDWPKMVKEGQNNWIGKSEGILINFPLVDSPEKGIEVFTTKPETIDGATFLVVAPEHELVTELVASGKLKEIQDYIEQAKKKTEMERKEDRTKSGVFSGFYVKNPVTGKDIPVWISDYVLVGYGTGAIMAVPAADERDREFAEKFNLQIVPTSFKAKPNGTKKVNYHLRDWSVSRQRYWGTPVPIIHCSKCGLVPVPYEDLPVELPYNVDYTPKGKPPLATDEDWLKVKCQNCGGEAKRDAETLDTFFDSAWYFYRYVSPEYDKMPFDELRVKELLPVDVYFGGSEHTLGHTLYARFFTKFFKDIGLIKFDEFAYKRAQHGVILGPDGNRMSKSKGNVVNPDDVVKEYGADTVRLYLCFMMPYEATAPWSETAISGIYRFIKRVWDLATVLEEGELSNEDLLMMHKTIKKVGQDLEMLQFNTAVSSLMIWLNYLTTKKSVKSEEYETLLKLLSPFAPHVTQELWHSINPNANFIYLEKWPACQEKYLISASINIVVSVNGKIRDTIEIQSSQVKDQDLIENEAKMSSKVNKYLASGVKKVIYVEGKIINFVV